MEEESTNTVMKTTSSDSKSPKFSDVAAALYMIRKAIVKTPCTYSIQLSKLFDVDLYFKKEFFQVTGSFKERGGLYALLNLTKDEKRNGVIAASAGNHALSLCYHGGKLNIPVTVVMPTKAPRMKINCCKSFGGNVIIKGESLEEAKKFALEIAEKKNLQYINGYNDPNVLAGQGTVALEILEQVEDVDAIVVPVGGGGLIAGMSLAIKALKPEIQIVGVESDSCPSFTQSLIANEEVYINPTSTLADGLAVPAVGPNSLAITKVFIDRMVTVSERSTALAILRLVELEKVVVEGAGAVGLAAFIEGKLDQLKQKRVVIVLSGGNIDTTVLGRTLERGLVIDSRLIQFDVLASDRPGGIAEITSLLASHGASVREIFHERAWISSDVFLVKIRIIAETSGSEHVNLLKSSLKERYKSVNFAHD